jgi:serine/threonine-protein phosphatase 5
VASSGGSGLRRPPPPPALRCSTLRRRVPAQSPNTQSLDHPSPPRPPDKHYAAAVVGYTQAIELRPGFAIYWANRAAAHIRLEEYGSAIADASQAIDHDPDYIKVRFCVPF